MGATNQIKGTNISLQLNNKECPQCLQPFTDQDLDNQNYDVWFDTTNDVKLTPMEELKDDAYYKPFGKKGYELTIWIRSIEHEYCPDTELCESCNERFSEDKMKEIDNVKGIFFYCQPCYQQISKNHE